MGRRVSAAILLVVSAVATIAIFAVAPTAISNRVKFGTFYTAGAPPRVDYCDRRYYPGDRTETLAEVRAFLARNGLYELRRIDTAPSGLPIVADVISPAVQAQHRTNVCTMALWVQTGPDSYVGYSLSGGP